MDHLLQMIWRIPSTLRCYPKAIDTQSFDIPTLTHIFKYFIQLALA
jgi:hypothetical protein